MQMTEPARFRQSVKRGISDRLDGAGYLLFILLFAVVAYYIAKEADWRIVAALLFAALVTILELGYRLTNK